ncbi:MAG: long-chain fatty acid--CoA ligase [Polyangiaceae bacterium]|jgi:long-chain acyl-CoA synthetase|nr:long-chain fatty acid--CoA ligase [Polyangiaceae bacterium]
MTSTITELFATQLRMGGYRPALRSKRNGRWTTTTWDEWNRRSRAMAAALIDAGVRKGDRVAILSNTREEWVVADVAILMAGAVTVPVYPTLTAEETAYIIDNSGAVAVFVENPQHFEKLTQRVASAALHKLRTIVVFDCRSLRDIPHYENQRSLSCYEVAQLVDVPSHVLADFVSNGETLLDNPGNAAALDARIDSLTADDLASIVYTAGAVGRPKGVMLSHGNFCFEIRTARETLEVSSRDEQLLFLPLAHIMGKALYITHLEIGGVISFAENMLRAIDNAAEINPTYFGSVPRVFEKFFAVAEKKAKEEGRVKERMYRWAIDVGHRMARLRRKGITPSLPLIVEHRYADRIVLSKLRARFGSRLRFAISGGAPLAAELAEWFDAIGITVLEGYGLTETTGASNINRPYRLKFGTVGPALNGVENKIASDGEILLRGDNIMKGYWQDPDATAEMIDEDGWLHSGDIGHLDADGMLKITDRKKDLIVTAAGKNVAPQNIENLMRQSPWIAHCVVVGDGRKYLAALVTLNHRALARWAAENDRPADPDSLATDPEVRAMIQLDIDSINHRLARYETIKDFAIIPHEFTITGGELTPTGKVKRNVIAKRFVDTIDHLYTRNEPSAAAE